MNFTLFSDGGGLKDSVAAGACIVENTAAKTRDNLVIFLGGATNNEAEISAGLLGFAWIKLLVEKTKTASAAVHWVADSEYTLKSATEYIHNWQRNGWKTANRKPVKNQGLWRTYLRLSAGLKVQMEHVAGHAGHTENEACDRASTWAQINAGDLLAMGTRCMPVEIDSESWILIDGREYISRMRNDAPSEEDSATLIQLLRQPR